MDKFERKMAGVDEFGTREYLESIKDYGSAPRKSTMTVNDLAMIRRIILEVIDDCTWEFYHLDETTANDERLSFCDLIQNKLTRVIK